MGWLQVDVDALRDREGDAVKRGLLDNYDDVEGYYNFQVRLQCCSLLNTPDHGDILCGWSNTRSRKKAQHFVFDLWSPLRPVLCPLSVEYLLLLAL